MVTKNPRTTATDDIVVDCADCDQTFKVTGEPCPFCGAEYTLDVEFTEN